MERLIREDKNGRRRFTDIRVEDLGNGTADIVKTTGMVGSDKVIESRFCSALCQNQHRNHFPYF